MILKKRCHRREVRCFEIEFSKTMDLIEFRDSLEKKKKERGLSCRYKLENDTEVTRVVEILMKLFLFAVISSRYSENLSIAY